VYIAFREISMGLTSLIKFNTCIINFLVVGTASDAMGVINE
jgi:hypothetical protein